MLADGRGDAGCGVAGRGVGDCGADHGMVAWWGALMGRAGIGVEMVGWGQEKRAGFDTGPNMVARLTTSVAVRVRISPDRNQPSRACPEATPFLRRGCETLRPSDQARLARGFHNLPYRHR